MISQSSPLPALRPRELADYGFARARDIAFDAIQTLWRRRQSQGMRQIDIVTKIGRDAGWVSRNMRAPGNWTIRTIGELVEALDGELEIVVHAKEDPPERLANFSAYASYEISHDHAITAARGASQVLGQVPAGFSGSPVIR
jgi:hypothetical protein